MHVQIIRASYLQTLKPKYYTIILSWGHLHRTSGKWGGGGFEISDIPGRGERVVCESSDVRKFLKKSKFQNFSELFKVKTRNYNRSRFQYESIHV